MIFPLVFWFTGLFISTNHHVPLATSIVEWQTPSTYDYGLLPQDKPPQTTFTFKNISQSPITIETTRTSCGCTVAQHSLEPIPTQGIGTIDVTFSARTKGYFSKKIKVFFFEQKKAEVLTIVGEVE